MNIYEQIKRNNHSTWIILAIFIILFLFIGLGADYYYGGGVDMPFFTTIALIIAVTSSYASYLYGDKLVLSSTHARPVDLNEPKQRQWENVVAEMSIAAGIPEPAVYVIDDPDPNAFATGRDPQHASIAVTKGLLGTLDRDELQAVASHEMGHIKNFDIRLMLMVAVLIGSIALLSDWTGRVLFRSSRRRSGSRNQGGGIIALVLLAIWIIAIILAPILSRLIAMSVSRKREYLADASGAELTRNPIALASALEKISSHTAPTRSINQGTAHLCIADPKGSAVNNKEGWFADLFATHPPINKRVEALRQMAYIGS